MIVEWIVGLATTVWAWFGSLWPDWTPPAFLVGVDNQVNDLLANSAGLGSWVDWPFVLACVGAVLAVWLITLIVKIALRVASYIPFFGGAG